MGKNRIQGSFVGVWSNVQRLTVAAFLVTGGASLSGCQFMQEPMRDPAAKVAQPPGGTGGGSGTGGGATNGGGTTSTSPAVSTKYSLAGDKFVGQEPVSLKVSSCAGVERITVTANSNGVLAYVGQALAPGEMDASCTEVLSLSGYSNVGLAAHQNGLEFTRYLSFYRAGGALIGTRRPVKFIVDRTGPARPTFGWKGLFGDKLRSPTVIGTFATTSTGLAEPPRVVGAYASANCANSEIFPASGSWVLDNSSSPASVTLTTGALNAQLYSYKVRLKDMDGNVEEHCSSLVGGQSAPSVELDTEAPTASISFTAPQGLMVDGTIGTFSVTFTDNVGIESVAGLSASSFELRSAVSGATHSCTIGSIGTAVGIGTKTARVAVTVTGCKSAEKFELHILSGQGARDYAGRALTSAAKSAVVEVIAPATSISLAGVGMMASAGELLPAIRVRVFGASSTEIVSGKVRLELLENGVPMTGYFAGVEPVEASLSPGGATFSNLRILRRGRFRIRASYGTLQETSSEIRVSWGFLRNNNAAPVLTHIDSVVSDASGTVYSVGTGATTAANQAWSSGAQNITINATSGTHLLLQKQNKDGLPLKLAFLPHVAPSTVVNHSTPETNILLRQNGRLIVVGRFTQAYAAPLIPPKTLGEGPFIAMFDENLVLQDISSLVTTASPCQSSDNNLRITSAAAGKNPARIFVAGYFGNYGSTVIDVCLNNGSRLNTRGNSDIFVAEVDSSAEGDFGKVDWHQTAGSPGFDQALAVAVDPVEGYPIIGGFHTPANTDIGRTQFRLAESGDASIPGTNCKGETACEALMVGMVAREGFLWWHQAGTGKAWAANTASNRVLSLQLAAPNSVIRDQYEGIILVGGVVSGTSTYTIANFGNTIAIRPAAADGFVALMTYNYRDLIPAWTKVHKIGGAGDDNVRVARISHDSYVFIAGEFRSLELNFEDTTSQALTRSCMATNCADLYVMELSTGSAGWSPRWSRKISSSGSDELEGLLMSDIAGCYVYGSFNASTAAAGSQQTFTGTRSTFNGFLTRIGAP